MCPGAEGRLERWTEVKPEKETEDGVRRPGRKKQQGGAGGAESVSLHAGLASSAAEAQRAAASSEPSDRTDG